MTNFLRALLNLPAPPPVSKTAGEDSERRKQGLYDKKNVPPDDELTMAVLSEIDLSSMDVWVDEPEKKVYFIYTGRCSTEAHLHALPLPTPREK